MRPDGSVITVTILYFVGDRVEFTYFSRRKGAVVDTDVISLSVEIQAGGPSITRGTYQRFLSTRFDTV